MVALLCVQLCFCEPPAPDPRALLAGAIEARNQIASGRMRIDLLEEQSGEPLPVQSKLLVEFRGSARTWRQDLRVVEVTDDGESGEVKERKLKAMNNDREAFVKAGLGKWSDRVLRSAFDGTQLASSSGERSASLHDPTAGIPEFAFDPRGLGILRYQGGAAATVESFLRPEGGKWQVVGPAKRAGVPVWHLRGTPFLRSPNAAVELWIEDREPFRVHEMSMPSDFSGSRTTSEFTSDDPKAVLPHRVIFEAFTRGTSGKVSRRLTLTVTQMNLNCDVSSDVGTIASLNLPPGADVTDLRLKRRIGYWNGTGLSEDFTEAMKLGKAKLQAQIDAEAATRWRWLLGCTAAALLFFLIAFRIRRSPKASS